MINVDYLCWSSQRFKSASFWHSLSQWSLSTLKFLGPAWGKVGGKYKKNDQRTQFMSQFLAANVAPCTYVDSLKMSKPGQWVTTDGQHFTVAGYKAWGNAIAEAMSKLPAASLKGGK